MLCVEDGTVDFDYHVRPAGFGWTAIAGQKDTDVLPQFTQIRFQKNFITL